MGNGILWSSRRPKRVPLLLKKFSLKEVKLDESGRSGVLYTLTMDESSNLGEHGIYRNVRTITEIWDIQARKPLFSDLNKYSFSANYMEYSDSAATYSEVNYKYEYTLTFTADKEVVISKAESLLELKSDYGGKFVPVAVTADNFPYYCDCLLPDHEAGTYRYSNGQYILVKN